MLYRYFFIVFTLLFINPLFSQNNQLISIPPNQPTPQQQAMIDQVIQNPSYSAAVIVKLDLSVLQQNNQFQLEFFGLNYLVNNDRTVQRGSNDYSWFGDNVQNDGDIILTVSKEEVQGIIFKENNMYRLLTLSDKSKAIARVDQNQFPEGDDIAPFPPFLQAAQLISTPANQPTPQQEAMVDQLLQNPSYDAAVCVELNLNALSQNNQVQLEFFDWEYTVNSDKTEQRAQNDYSWFGDNAQNDGDIILTVLNDEVQGTIFKGNNMYRLLTLADKSKAIARVDQNQFPEGECITPPPPLIQAAMAKHKTTNTGEMTLREKAGLGCTMRALVMYTQEAEDELKGEFPALSMKTIIQSSVNRTNQSFENSEIFDYDALELALIQKTNYVEGDSMSIDLYNFAIKDGDYGVTGIYDAMDEVHTLRELYDADFCVLVTASDKKYCGKAVDYRTVASNSFCVVTQSCIVDGLTFAHELGHLLGCHHDEFVATNKKYDFGHGYVYFDTEPLVPEGRRTIMAYRSKCTASGAFKCTQIPYWSNPDVLDPVLNVPMGTADKANNARVISLYSDTLFTFEQPANNVWLQGANFSQNPYSFAEAKQQITTNGNVIVQDKATLLLKAKNQVQLNNGFFAKQGSQVDIDIEDVSNCE